MGLGVGTQCETVRARVRGHGGDVGFGDVEVDEHRGRVKGVIVERDRQGDARRESFEEFDVHVVLTVIIVTSFTQNTL
jgi:hypothetical protein